MKKQTDTDFKIVYDEKNENVDTPLNYLDIECPNCGRLRVELYKSGRHICEKCRWCIQTNDYAFDQTI